MNKFLSVLVAGAFAAGLSATAFAADSAKPAAAPVALTATTAKVEANKAVTSKVAAKKDTGIKASVKKLFSPSTKTTDVKVK